MGHAGGAENAGGVKLVRPLAQRSAARRTRSASRRRESVKTRLRNDLNLSLGDINGLRQRLNPANELALVAYPPVDIKARRAAAALRSARA